MSKQIRIRPDETAQFLESVHSRLATSIKIESVQVDLESRSLTVHISSKTPPPDSDLEVMTQALKERVGALGANARVIWRPAAPTTLTELLACNREAIRESILETLPSLRTCVKGMELIPHGESCIEVRLPGQVHSARASRKQFRESLTNALSLTLGRKILLRVSAGEESADAIPEEEEASVTPEMTPGPHPDLPKAPLMGRSIAADPVPIRDIIDEAKGVVLKGQVFGVEYRSPRNGTSITIFNVTDGTDSITVKVHGKSPFTIDEGTYIKVRGDVLFDKYAEEIVLTARDIVAVDAPPERLDTSEKKRVELHLHTKMSSMDSVLEIEDTLKTLHRWGHKACAITDHGVVQAFPLAHDVASRLGIKVIYGLEGYLVETGAQSDATYHITLLAKDQEGLRALYRLVSISHLEHFYKRPRIVREEIAQMREHLLVGSACEAGELYQALESGKSEDEVQRIASFYDYLEIQPLGNNLFLTDSGEYTEDDLMQFNKRIYLAGKKLNKPVVAAGDVHFLHPEDSINRKVLITAQGYEGAERESPLYLRTTQEMLEEFWYLGKEASYEVTVENPCRIAEGIEDLKPVPSGFYAPDIPNADVDLESIARAEAERLYGNPLPELVSARLERELKAITGGGFAGIYAICRQLVLKSTSDGYLVGSRGSVGSSFVATLTGITEVNPLDPHYLCSSCKYSDFSLASEYDSGFDLPPKQCPVCGKDLLRDGHKIAFEVFMGFKGDKVPDIDLNFSGENQGAVIKYTEELLGKGNVFRAGTIATVADRTAFGLVRAYCEATGKRPRKAEMLRLARGIAGVKRTTGQHPGGVLVLPAGKDIYEFTPLQYPADDRKSGTVTTHFDYESMSSRLVKMDILGHDDPTALRMLQDYTGIDPKQVPFFDKDTVSIFSGTEVLGYKPEDIGSPVGAIGIPEFGTRFVRQMLSDTRPKDFSGLCRISGLSHGTDVWLNNAQDIIKAGTASLGDVICARDDILNYLTKKKMDKAHSFKIMENVRKGKGISQDDVKAMKDAQVPDWYTESCGKIKYLFPKAHAVAYVMMAFRIAYFKVHYPEAFYAQYLSLRADDVDLATILAGPGAIRTRIEEIEGKGQEATPKEKDQAVVLEVAFEMLLRGIGLLAVSLYESDALRFTIKGKKLLPPFVSLPGMGQAAARNLEKSREEGPYLSIEDLRQRARLQRNLVDLLRKFGCLNDLPELNQITLF